MGSCFSENIGAKLAEAKFKVKYNPLGIVFDPLSLARHLDDIRNNRVYTEADLFEFNELFNCWNFHSEFSSTEANQTLTSINTAITQTREWLQHTSHLFVTLGTAYHYTLKSSGQPVANNHKAPGAWFDKHLLDTSVMVDVLNQNLKGLKQLFPHLQVVVTVSPVKHIRDGIVENVRSKSRLIEVAHQLNETLYFPAYELVTEVLRDYRFYKPDMAHPSEQAIDAVFDFFCQSWMSPQTLQWMGEVNQIRQAYNHRVLFPGTRAHQQFKQTMLSKINSLQTQLPQLDWQAERMYFETRD